MDFQKVEAPYRDMVLADGSPNEAWLADFRNRLKAMEEGGAGVLVVPTLLPADCKDTDAALQVTAACKHCARRIKDCAVVKGFAVPQAFVDMERGPELVENFKAELLEKHPHYVFE